MTTDKKTIENKWCGYWYEDNGLKFHALSTKCKNCPIVTHDHIIEN